MELPGKNCTNGKKCKKMSFLSKSTALTLAAVLATSSMAVAESNGYSDEFGQQVEQYILDNPEVVLKALILLEEQEEAAQENEDLLLISKYSERLFDSQELPQTPFVTVFVDYQCGYCKMAEPQVLAAQSKIPELKIKYVQFPILGEMSTRAAKFSEAVRLMHGEEIYAKVHQALMAGDVTRPGTLQQTAVRFGFDFQLVAEAMESPEVDQKIRENHHLARELKITGTPGFVFPNKIIRGMANEQQIIQIATEAGES